jgi:hypothetical protein
LELEDFPSKVRIGEEKQGVATEEREVHYEAKNPNQNIIKKNVADQILGVNHQVVSGSEEERRAFVPRKRNFDGLKKLLKTMNYWCTCASIHT